MTNDQKAKRRNLTITDADYAWLQKLGNGNASKGVRLALSHSGALCDIAEWPDGGNGYGQEHIKRFAKSAIEGAE